MLFIPNAANAQVRGGTATQRTIRRSYKPVPTLRYMATGMTAILLSMALISGSMSSTMHVDQKPWDISQEPVYDPFGRQRILDIGSLSDSSSRQELLDKHSNSKKNSSPSPTPSTSSPAPAPSSTTAPTAGNTATQTTPPLVSGNEAVTETAPGDTQNQPPKE